MVVRITGPKDDFFDSMRKYWGSPGYYISVIATLTLMEAVTIAYFLIMSQMLYPNFVAISNFLFATQLKTISEPSFTQFSSVHVCLFLYLSVTL
jgi:hypothetical protein